MPRRGGEAAVGAIVSSGISPAPRRLPLPFDDLGWHTWNPAGSLPGAPGWTITLDAARTSQVPLLPQPTVALSLQPTLGESVALRLGGAAATPREAERRPSPGVSPRTGLAGRTGCSREDRRGSRGPRGPVRVARSEEAGGPDGKDRRERPRHRAGRDRGRQAAGRPRRVVSSRRSPGFRAADESLPEIADRAAVVGLDALVLAPVAATAKAGRTDPQPGADAERARREGW